MGKAWNVELPDAFDGAWRGLANRLPNLPEP
jgi:hypothetical protein